MTRVGPREDAVQTSASGLARLLGLPPLFISPLSILPGSERRTGPVRTRLAFEQLGGAWVKLGQMLALRFDLLPPPYCDELFKLLNEVAPFPYAEVREIIRERAGRRARGGLPLLRRASRSRPLDRPGAPGGLAHRRAGRGEGPAARHSADTPGGHPPDVRDDLAAGLDPSVRGDPQPRIIDELARWTADELDFLVEARQALLLYEHAKDDTI